jgi:hypothetical protein
MEAFAIVLGVAFLSMAFCTAALLRAHGRMADRFVALASPASAESLGRLRGVSIPKKAEPAPSPDELKPTDFGLPLGMDRRYAADFDKDDGN